MAFTYDSINATFKAEGDLSALQYHAVKKGTDVGQVLQAGANQGFGILQNDPTDGEEADVVELGYSKAVVDGSAVAIVFDDPLAADASGHLVKEVTDNDAILAKARGASSAAGDIIPVLVIGSVRY